LYKPKEISGFLYKVGGPFGYQRKRRFVWNEPSRYIHYYKNTTLKGTIELQNLVRMSALEKINNGKELWFTWFTSTSSVHSGSYRLRCENEADYDAWAMLFRAHDKVVGNG
jgi:hypothetical protein